MSDDKNNLHPQNRTRINIHEPHEIEYWSKMFGVSPRLLRELVQKHGVNAETVRKAAQGRVFPDTPTRKPFSAQA